MFDANSGPSRANGYSACSGCGLCQLVCPVWRETRDVRFTPHGRAKALQHGAAVADIAESIEGCTLCGACEPVCPEHIDLVGMVVGLRRATATHAPVASRSPASAPGRSATAAILLAGASLSDHTDVLTRSAALLGVSVHADDGADIADALETGAVVSPERLEQFLSPLRGRRQIIVGDGLLVRHLRGWIPRAKAATLGAALSALPAVRRNLSDRDLYIVETRGYHADRERLVRHYDELRRDTGCSMNLDLHRIAIPTTSRRERRAGMESTDAGAEQTRWLLQGRTFSRIVVESFDDVAPLARASDRPIVHVSQLADVASAAWQGDAQ